MKFESLRTARRYWIAGIATSLIGIVLARVVAPHFADKAGVIVKFLGQLLAIIGLFIIAIGVNRRSSGQNTPDS